MVEAILDLRWGRKYDLHITKVSSGVDARKNPNAVKSENNEAIPSSTVRKTDTFLRRFSTSLHMR